MKKKLTVATVLILLLAVSLTMFVGCDEMFSKNDERDATQVVATVNYNKQSANIYKFELESSFNSYSYIYVNYYGMSNKEAADYILRSLAQQKLLALYAKEKVTSLMGLPAMPEKVEALLTKSEVNKAIEDTNESLLNNLKTIVEDNITDDSYNNGSNESSKKDEDDGEEEEIKEPVYITYESNGGTAIDRQRYQKGTVKAKKPTDPTKDGFVFYGWYDNAKFEGDKFEDGKFVSGEYDFKTQLNNSITLYAKWVETTAARTEIPEVEEEEEDDYDPDNDNVEQLPKFFSDEYKATIAEKFKDEEFVEKIEESKLNKTLASYIEDGLAELSKNLKSYVYKKTNEDCYAYYLANQMDSVLIEKMKRLIVKDISVSEAEVEAEFNAVVKKNKQTFSGSNAESAYSSALTNSLNGTYFHPNTTEQDSYGFVINILLKLGDDDLKILTDMCTQDPSPTGVEKAKIMRNRLISNMTVKISNPNYKSSEVVEDKDGNEIELRDPMTDPRNPYNNVGVDGNKKATYNQEYQVKYDGDKYNDYNNLITFGKAKDDKGNEIEGKFEIKFGATEHPAMAYLLDEYPAFDDKDGKVVGIIHQIHNSLNQVLEFVKLGPNNGGLTKEQGVYWLREVATKWLYLVGDDSGSVSDSSNNGGLGYLVTPEGQESSFLSDFTDYARKLIKKGTGSFFADGFDESTAFLGANATGNADMAGNGTAYVVADSFIGTGATSFDNAYAGVFVLLNSYTVWDDTYYSGENSLPEDGVIPLDFKLGVAKNQDDIKTIYQTIEESILEAKKTAAYNLDVNTMGIKYMEEGIVYYEKAYKSLWKNKD